MMAGIPVEREGKAKTKMMTYFKEDLNRVQAFVFDVDGVFTDGSMLLSPDGELMRSMNIKDGFATQLAVRKGYPIAIITGGNSESVRKRFGILGVNDVYLKSSRKIDDFTDFCSKHKLAPENVFIWVMILPDYPVMKSSRIPCLSEGCCSRDQTDRKVCFRS
jgi:3-deoxy-D-manno-octulosonate 8-phosphate phosphatase (KDO 8-P phosphatase)